MFLDHLEFLPLETQPGTNPSNPRPGSLPPPSETDHQKFWGEEGRSGSPYVRDVFPGRKDLDKDVHLDFSDLHRYSWTNKVRRVLCPSPLKLRWYQRLLALEGPFLFLSLPPFHRVCVSPLRQSLSVSLGGQDVPFLGWNPS